MGRSPEVDFGGGWTISPWRPWSRRADRRGGGDAESIISPDVFSITFFAGVPPMSTVLTPVFDRPAAGEFNPYYSKYIDQVPEGDVLETLARQEEETVAFLRGLPAELHGHRYAEGKWSIREVVGHVADAERIFAYRALRIARGDQTPLPSFDENAYADTARYDQRDLGSIVDEWVAVRRATLALFDSMSAEEAKRTGTASESPVSVRALAWIVAGHAFHHEKLLRERYLGAS